MSDPSTAREPGARPDYPQMGERLRAARTARGLSLRVLASRLGVSPSLISQIETGRANPSVSTLYAIAAELDVSLDELLFNDRRPPEVAVPPAETVASPTPIARARRGPASCRRPRRSRSRQPRRATRSGSRPASSGIA